MFNKEIIFACSSLIKSALLFNAQYQKGINKIRLLFNNAFNWKTKRMGIRLDC